MIEEPRGERVMEQYLPRIRLKSMAFTAGKGLVPTKQAADRIIG